MRRRFIDKVNNYLKSFLKSLTYTFKLNGRTSRNDFLIFIFFYYLLIFIAQIISDTIGVVIASIFSISFISICARRLQDVNKSKWFLLLPILNIIYLIRKGDLGTNKFGKLN